MIRIAKLLPQVDSNHRPHKLIRPAAIVGNNTQGIHPPMLCALPTELCGHKSPHNNRAGRIIILLVVCFDFSLTAIHKHIYDIGI